jgi:hypothetical protein
LANAAALIEYWKMPLRDQVSSAGRAEVSRDAD